MHITIYMSRAADDWLSLSSLCFNKQVVNRRARASRLSQVKLCQTYLEPPQPGPPRETVNSSRSARLIAQQQAVWPRCVLLLSDKKRKKNKQTHTTRTATDTRSSSYDCRQRRARVHSRRRQKDDIPSPEPTMASRGRSRGHANTCQRSRGARLQQKG